MLTDHGDAAPSAAPHRPPRPLLYAGLAVMAVLAATAHAIEGDFVWDDRPLILNQAQVRELGSLTSYFLRPFWEASPDQPEAVAFYRPLTTLSYALDHAVHGPNATGFHLTNLLFHALNVALLFAFARRLGAAVVAATLASVAWGVSPRLAESFAWVSGRTDVLATTFALAALLVWDRASVRRTAASAVLVALGALAKEVALAAAVGMAVAGVAAWLRVPAEARERAASAFTRAVAPLVVALGVSVGLRVAAGIPFAGDTLALGAFGRAWTVLEALGRYAFMLATPWAAHAQLGLLGVLDARFCVLGAAVLVALVALAVRFGRRSPSAQVLAAWVTVAAALGLVLHVAPLSGLVVAADRFLYLPTALICALVARGAAAVAPARRRAVAGVALAATLLLGATGFARVSDWRDEAALWASTLDGTHPANGRPRYEIGSLYFRAGLHADALAAYDASAAAYGRHPEKRLAWQAELAAVRVMLLLGRYDDAVRRLAGLAEVAPVAALHVELARAHLARFDFDAAEAATAQALRQHPAFAPALALHRSVRNARELHRGLRDAPPDASWTLPRRASLAASAGRLSEALDGYRAVLRGGRATQVETGEAVLFLVRFGEPEEATELYLEWGPMLPDAETLAAGILEREERRRRLGEVFGTGR